MGVGWGNKQLRSSYIPAMNNDCAVSGSLLPPLNLTNEIYHSSASIGGTNIRPTSVMILTNNSRSTLLITLKEMISRLISSCVKQWTACCEQEQRKETSIHRVKQEFLFETLASIGWSV